MKKLLAFIAGVAFSASMSAQQKLMPYQDTNLSAERRAEDLVCRLTLEEKAQLMMDNSPAIKRWGIPQFQWWNEALHGVARNGTATVFPITMGMAASWDDDLLHRVYTAVSDEARAKAQAAKKAGKIQRYQSLSFWTPNINIFRDPRWGRGQETYGEDPYLTSRMGVAVVKGLQGPKDAKYMKTLACAKHFAVHSGPEWNRHSFNVENLSERHLWETYIPAFKALIQEADVEEVMCAYQSIDGEPCCGNNRYLKQILRNDLGFKGLVTSDCWAITDFFKVDHHNFTDSEQKAAGLAVRAGTDVECGPHYATLPQAVAEGAVTEKEIDESLKRLIVARIKIGDFDPDDMVEWTKIPESVVGCDEHRQLALQMARESIVLMQNKSNVLPLKKDGMKIAVLGPNANDSTMQWGNYNGFPRHTVTILDGIKSKNSNVVYIPGCGHTSNTGTESRFTNVTSPDGKAGLRATYYNNETFEGDAAAVQYHTTPLALSNGGATVFAPGVNLEHFTARYEGVFNSKADETFVFTINADDAVRLIVDGDTLMNRWRAGGVVRNRQETVKVKAGQKLNFCIEYMQTVDMAMMHFDIKARVERSTDAMLAQLKDADVVVFVGGISPRLEGEEMKVDAAGFKGGDRTDIELPKVQRDMLATIKKMGKRIVYVNCSGSAIGLVPESENCDAIVQAWYSGEQGGAALADVLFGDYNPSGKLPVTFYKNVNQLPDFEDYEMEGRTYRFMTDSPLFPFGHGLSYSDFTLSKIKYVKDKVTFSIKNNGAMDGDEVVQVYLRRVGDEKGPKKTLRAFKRIGVKAGETVATSIDLPRTSFEWWDESNNVMRILPGKYDLMVGTSSDAAVVKTISIK